VGPARSAYEADLDSDPDSPGAFIGWLSRALEEHVARTPQQRAQRGAVHRARGVGTSFNKGNPLKKGVVDALDEVVVTDGEELGRMVARSGFGKEAVLPDAEDARRRLGRALAPPAARLPNRHDGGRRPPVDAGAPVQATWPNSLRGFGGAAYACPRPRPVPESRSGLAPFMELEEPRPECAPRRRRAGRCPMLRATSGVG